MAKYKLLNQDKWPEPYTKGEIYSTERDSYLLEFVANFPDDWELIEENESMEKQIKLSLDTAKKLYVEGGAGKAFALDNYSEEELTKKKLPKSWEELGKIDGYYIDNVSFIWRVYNKPSHASNKNFFATKKQAKSALAMAQLSQLMAVYNGDWVADYSNANEVKIQIICISNKLVTSWSCEQNEFLSFPTAELRDEFLANFKPLIKAYFMID